ncbi:MAG: RNA-binding protein [Rhodobiaceae bacterium]|nr:RNA-binding protein [Rhodobiaceae bacterium]
MTDELTQEAELDRGPGLGKAPAARQRSCIVTRRAMDPEGMIRFVRDPAGAVVPDLKNRLPGRGAWVLARRDSVETALRKKAFARAFRSQTPVDPGLADLVDRLLAAQVLGGLGLARKAGAAVTGQEQVEKRARSGELAVVFHASDGAADGWRKVAGALRATGQLERVVVVSTFSCDELSLALGLANVIHAAVPAGQSGAAVARAARRLLRYRGADGENTGMSAGPEIRLADDVGHCRDGAAES